MFTAYRATYIRLVAPLSPSEVPIRPAATIVLARPGVDALEVLMVRRNRDAVFMGGARVFPGGGVDTGDDSHEARAAVRWSGDPEEFPWRAAALRELFEEAGVLLGTDGVHLDPELRGVDVYRAVADRGALMDADALEYFANWVTPLGPPRRYDARFYVAAASPEVVTDDSEVFDAEWVAPAEALRRAVSGEWFVEFPTRRTLEDMAGHASIADLIDAAARVEVERIAPRIAGGPDGSHRILLPGDDGYDEAPA
jgi:8-oxo-dGTP pyrophosphatase MutT (NUDIX family)